MEKKKSRTTFTQCSKLPPQALDMEEAVLGALMCEKEAINKINLNPNDFYKISHERIFLAIQNLHHRHNPIDILTVKNELERIGELDNVGGAYTLTVLQTNVSSAANIEYHSQIIKQKSIARKMISLCAEVQNMAFDNENDISDILEFHDKSYTDIFTGSVECDASDMFDSLELTLNSIQKIQADALNGISSGIPTGLKELDKQLNGGWKAPDLIVLGGRPSMGKTQFAVHFSKYAGMSDNDTLFISIEMTKIQLVLRMITENEGLDLYRIKTGKLTPGEWQMIDETVNSISKLKLHIADDSEIRYLSNIKSLARKQSRKGKLKLMIIDYLQLIETGMKFGTRDLEIGYITRELKSLCKELNIPILLLAQLNRPVKGSKVLSPKLEDLRESGNIEQDADIVIFPHRPSYYDSDAKDETGENWKQRGGLLIAKHREGERDVKVLFRHDKAFKKIWDGDSSFNEVSSVQIDKNTTKPVIEKEQTALPF